MSEPIKCNRFREDLPLLFSGRLSDEEKLQMRSHLETCPECRSLYRSEAALMAVASADRSQDLLGDHPDTEELDAYVFSRSTLNPDDLVRIEDHIKDCPGCREVVEKLKQLPQQLDNLVAPAETPFIDSLADPEVVDITEIRRTKPTPIASWRWMGAVAAAALVILVSVLMVTDRFPGQLRQARVDIEFIDSGETVHLQELRRTPTTRPIVTATNGWIFIDLDFDAYPDEESYRVAVEGADGKLAVKEVSADDFSSPGRLMLKIRTAALNPGEYRLRLDIYSRDSQEPPATLIFPFVLSGD